MGVYKEIARGTYNAAHFIADGLTYFVGGNLLGSEMAKVSGGFGFFATDSLRAGENIYIWKTGKHLDHLRHGRDQAIGFVSTIGKIATHPILQEGLLRYHEGYKNFALSVSPNLATAFGMQGANIGTDPFFGLVMGLNLLINVGLFIRYVGATLKEAGVFSKYLKKVVENEDIQNRLKVKTKYSSLEDYLDRGGLADKIINKEAKEIVNNFNEVLKRDYNNMILPENLPIDQGVDGEKSYIKIRPETKVYSNDPSFKLYQELLSIRTNLNTKIKKYINIKEISEKVTPIVGQPNVNNARKINTVKGANLIELIEEAFYDCFKGTENAVPSQNVNKPTLSNYKRNVKEKMLELADTYYKTLMGDINRGRYNS